MSDTIETKSADVGNKRSGGIPVSSDRYATFIAQFFTEQSEQFAELILNASSEMSDSTKLAIVSRLLEAEKSSRLNPLMVFAEEVFPEMVKQHHADNHHFSKQTFAPVEDYDVMYTTGDVKKVIGRSVNNIKEQVAQLKLIGYKVGARTKLPKWQFGQDCVVPGVDTILNAIGKNGVDAEAKFTLQLDRYDGKCIIDALREGDIELAQEMLESM